MATLSILDLSPISEGSNVQQALRDSIELAQHAEKLDFHRFWLAEHHNIPTIASTANTIIIGQILAATKKMIVGAGGVMLPNHRPLIVAEQFATLANFYPARVDLGLGRAAGGDMATLRALGRNDLTNNDFPQQVKEVLHYLSGEQNDGVSAIPAGEVKVPVGILGTSLYGAKLAAKLGLPYTFAAHFAPAMLEQALDTYRSSFKPSSHLAEPYFMMSIGFYGADTDKQALALSSSIKLHFAELRSGNIGKLARPVNNIQSLLPVPLLQAVEQHMTCSAIGNQATVNRQVKEIVGRYQPDEIMISAMIHDPVARHQSLKMAAEAFAAL